MFEDILAQHGSKFLIAAVSVLLGLGCLALVLWIVRNRPSSPFIRGGRNRQPRLAVLDAAAVDTRRRLVLVRRDEVEHLIMIGGPTDIVIESRIAGTAAPASAETAAEPAAAAREVRPAETPSRGEPAPIAAALAVPRGSVAADRAEHTRSAPQENVSAMSRVLYGGDRDVGPASRGVQPAASGQQRAGAVAVPLGQPGSSSVQRPAVRPAVQPAGQPPAYPASGPSSPVAQPGRPTERSAADALEQARQRVLTATPATASAANRAEPANFAIPARGVANPAQPAADNAELVSEFEKILEAEMANPPARSAQVSTVARPDPLAGRGADGGKSREETEAEMARLLGEISANRKG